MKVLVTGATGFIGAHTVTRLLQGGHDVAALTRTSAPALERAGMKAVRGDVADPAEVLGAMAGCEALIHLANVYSSGRGIRASTGVSTWRPPVASSIRRSRRGCLR